MKLIYIPKAGVSCPGDGWPATDHEELDASIAARKVASGFYRRENQEEKIESDKEFKEAKQRANAKFDEAATYEIAAADQAVEAANEAAAETRRRLGREGQDPQPDFKSGEGEEEE